MWGKRLEQTLIISGLAEAKKDRGAELLDKMEVGMEELQKIVEDRNRDAVAPKQKELLQYVGEWVSQIFKTIFCCLDHPSMKPTPKWSM